ncbi:MAG TPA: c-type cytochrome [Puia sp.]|uniref:c-type cytochrome n=1 Tax=Puia sp. TaxID=2045100 RepID=UPI002BF3DFA5|nr:c-type cytochrome [Puia sp.]HVU95743.1 c-type cytochrome [Puia sp.]
MTKQLVAAFSITVLLAACGGSGDKKANETKDTTTSAATTTPATAGAGNAAADKALDLIGASDCTTCHRLHKAQGGSSIGPAYDDVAAKYSPAADTTVDRLVKKVISGGSGVWGTVPMTPHPNLKPEDVKTMVTYVLTLKQ